MEDIMSPQLDAQTRLTASTAPLAHLSADGAGETQESREDSPVAMAADDLPYDDPGHELPVLLADLPEIPPYDEVGPLDARALSKTLFARLETLTEGTAEFAYVRNTLVELNLALVKFAASRFRSRSEPMEDIIQVGTIGLIKAIDRFELSRGVEFPTFAMPTIIGEIKRFFRDTSWSVRVPRRLQELRLDLAKAGDELAQKLDRAPTVRELADRLGLSQEEVVEGMAASNAYTASSLDAQPEEDDSEGALADRIGYEDHGIEGIEYVESLKPLIAELPARDRRILSLRFTANMTQSEIGEELGISQMHVSRLLTRTLNRLRKGLTVVE
ncbi:MULTISPECIES: RNA polymerase sigma factor SigF [Streptomyces]|jgi:RNA polymerase sigma-B factor|uniref:RNA polymerase sigma factor SigF n=1 Tax=Streptomyces odorifer TaxID=53450 RepID=A0A7Y6C6A4_9ACTN|nr:MULTISPECIES: RNA polymerase sigma factor SigF [Streptomyces]NUV33142.1 RNA polymerase sigma factor SigF [Streptomyces sp. KAI-27]NUV47686.1 RNA polymerase sigma factor SigF [Streptomyces sp. CAI-78]MBL0776537.1 RNA polymerase sigma factor SigF [Streptomyces albidoflavus]MBL0800381.1 RNA polymerase sigma factor SigF [Streptomyces albidoflavus]MBV1956436.1 RNA polymerase sigma factor SigF [Streptomyces sp. BV333]